jgi:hypothetical protein
VGSAAEFGERVPLALMLDRPKGKDLTDDDLRQIARYAAVNDRLCRLSPAQVKRLREIHPGIMVFRYANVANGLPVVRRKELKQHPEWFLKDRKGEPVPTLPGAKLPLVDDGNEAWRRFLAERCALLVERIGYDGLMLDVVQMANSNPEVLKAINPRTGRAFTLREWRDAQYGLVAAVRAAVGPDVLLIGNSVGRGTTYFQEGAARFLTLLDGVVAEGFRGPLRNTRGRRCETSDWFNTVKMIRDVEGRGKYFLAYSKFLKQNLPGREEKRREDRFWFATFLLGMGPRSYYASVVHDPHDAMQSFDGLAPLWTVRCGRPIGGLVERDGVYRRTFEHGLVLVNASGRDRQVELSPPLLRVGADGRGEGTPLQRIKVHAHEAELLIMPE